MVPLAAIQSFPRFAGTSSEAQAWIAERIVRQAYVRGDTVFLEGDRCGHLHLLERGLIKVVKTLENGRELILDVIRPGESFGEVALIDEVDYPATAAALEPSSVLSLRGEDYRTLMTRFPESSLAIIRELTLRMHSLRRRVEQLGEGGVESRLAHVLAAFARTMGQSRGDGILIPIQITRQELADMVGARIETVIRIMSRWQKEDQVYTTGEGFLVGHAGILEQLVRREP